MDGLTDTELVNLARTGDRDAFGLLIERHRQMTERVALGVVRHEETARELAHEAMVQAYLSLCRLRDASRFQSWLYGIVLNVCKGFFRDQKSAPFSLEALTGGLRFEAAPFVGVEPGPQDNIEAQELHRTVLNAVNSLSPRIRAATLLFYYEQLSVREVAATLGVSVTAVKGRLYKARSQLREQLIPVYWGMGRLIPEIREARTMVQVTIADVIEKEGPEGYSYAAFVVALLDQEGRRVLPIWIGKSEGTAIAMGLKDIEVPRPMTFDFITSLLKAAGVELEEVRIESIKGDTFFAVVKLRCGESVREVDARPSDAMALAVYNGKPIYVAEDVMARATLDIPEEVGEAEPRGRGLAKIAQAIEEHHASEAKSKTRLDMIRYLFSGDDEE